MAQDQPDDDDAPPLIEGGKGENSANKQKQEESAVFDFTKYTGLGKGELPFWVVLGAVLVLALWVAKHLSPTTEVHPAAVYALVALCCLSVGSILGFLFGIPHADGTLAPANADAPGNPSEGGNRRSSPSTSLEQVSDWLTKIIIGVGLVEFDRIQKRLAGLGASIAKAAGLQEENAAVPQLFVVTFGVLGFLAGYIWTRIYYGGIQAKADVNMRDIQNTQAIQIQNLETTVKKVAQSAAQASNLATQASDLATTNEQRIGTTETALEGQNEKQKTQNIQQEVITRGIARSAEAKKVTAPSPESLAAPADSALGKWAPKLAEFLAAPPDWDADTTVNTFGQLPEENGRRKLKCSIVSLSANRKKNYFFKAELTSSDGTKLPEKVIFLLHPTFSRRAVEVTTDYPKEAETGCATYYFYGEPSFTVVAMTDNGDTLLGFDLSQLPPSD